MPTEVHAQPVLRRATPGRAGVIALAGRRIDAVGAPAARFPLERVAYVAHRLRSTFRALRGGILVCSAANGADLTALRVARELGMRRRIVLPFGVSRFRRMSVTDRPGGELWGWLFDELVDEAGSSGELVILAKQSRDVTDAFVAANAHILRVAAELADGGKARPTRPLAGVVVWEGTSRGSDDITASFVDRLRDAELPVRIISPVPR